MGAGQSHEFPSFEEKALARRLGTLDMTDVEEKDPYVYVEDDSRTCHARRRGRPYDPVRFC